MMTFSLPTKLLVCFHIHFKELTQIILVLLGRVFGATFRYFLGTENDSMLSSKSSVNQTVKQPSADTIEPVSNDSPPVDTVDSYKTINSDSPSNSSKLL